MIGQEGNDPAHEESLPIGRQLAGGENDAEAAIWERGWRRLRFREELRVVARAEFGLGEDVERSLDGPPLVALPLAVEATNEGNRFQATGAVPIGGLPVGDYLVRVSVGPEGGEPASVVRTLRKSTG